MKYGDLIFVFVKMKQLQTFVLIILLSSWYPTVYKLINQKENYFWIGEAAFDTIQNKKSRPNK